MRWVVNLKKIEEIKEKRIEEIKSSIEKLKQEEEEIQRKIAELEEEFQREIKQKSIELIQSKFEELKKLNESLNQIKQLLEKKRNRLNQLKIGELKVALLLTPEGFKIIEAKTETLLGGPNFRVVELIDSDEKKQGTFLLVLVGGMPPLELYLSGFKNFFYTNLPVKTLLALDKKGRFWLLIFNENQIILEQTSKNFAEKVKGISLTNTNEITRKIRKSLAKQMYTEEYESGILLIATITAGVCGLFFSKILYSQLLAVHVFLILVLTYFLLKQNLKAFLCLVAERKVKQLLAPGNWILKA